jgi:hypothetical protein
MEEAEKYGMTRYGLHLQLQEFGFRRWVEFMRGFARER